MNILKDILENKRQEVAFIKKSKPIEQLKNMQDYGRKCFSLQKALRSENVAVIAEIKKASPSKNVIREDFDPLKIALDYVAGGASAISVLTDRRYFQGDIRHIADIRSSVPIPLLRKDFIIDSYQIQEAKAFGSDAVLLITAALESERLRDLHAEATGLGLDCLVEVHNEQELEKIDLATVAMIGINNRNLLDFTIDISTTLRVAEHIPPGITIVSESGIAGRADVEFLASHGIQAVLVGESLMRTPNPGKAIQSLIIPLKKKNR